MSVASMLRQTCDTQRNTAVGTNGRKAFQANLTGQRCMFVPMSAEAAIQYQYKAGYAWTVFFQDGTDVRVGDKLIWKGQNYLVKGKKPFTDYGIVSNLEVMVESENTNGQ